MNDKFDERQLLIRGRIFQIGFFYLAVFFLLSAFIKSFGILWADDFSVAIIGIMSATGICSVLLIVKDAYAAPGSIMWNVAVASINFAAVAALFSGIAQIQRFGFSQNGTLTDGGRTIILGGIMLIISVTYWVKKYIDQRAA